MFDVESLLKYPRYVDHSREVFDMVMDTAMKMGKDLFKPIFSEMDKNPPEYVKGEVKVACDIKPQKPFCRWLPWWASCQPSTARKVNGSPVALPKAF